MEINNKATIIFLSIGLLADLVILTVSIYAMFQRKNEGLLLWGKWTLLVPLGFAPGLYFGATVVSEINETLGLLFMGFALGVSEWFVIRKYLDTPGPWIFATVIGWAGAISLTQYESHVSAYFCGAFIGVTQYLVIGKQFSRSTWWIIANLIGIAYFVFQINIIFNLLSRHFDWRFFTVLGLSMFMYSAITGVTIVWLLQRNDRMIRTVKSNNGVTH